MENNTYLKKIFLVLLLFLSVHPVESSASFFLKDVNNIVLKQLVKLDWKSPSFFGKLVYSIVAIVTPFYNFKRQNNITKIHVETLKEKSISIDPEIGSFIKNKIGLEPENICVIGDVDSETDFTFNNTVYLREKTIAKLKSDNEKERYSRLGIVAHEYNHILNGDAKTDVSTKHLFQITHLMTTVLCTVLYYYISPFNKVVGRGYIKEGFINFFKGCLQDEISNISVKQVKKHMEYRADRVFHEDQVEHYKLLSGLESYLDEDNKKMKNFVEQLFVDSKALWISKIFFPIVNFLSGYPSHESRIAKINKKQNELLQNYPEIKEKIDSNTLWENEKPL